MIGLYTTFDKNFLFCEGTACPLPNCAFNVGSCLNRLALPNYTFNLILTPRLSPL